jgi:nucleoside-diphosphate-sugar epimerase
MTELKFFVTDALGFIGQALIKRLLHQGHFVIAGCDSLSAIAAAKLLPEQPNLTQLTVNQLGHQEFLTTLSSCDYVVHVPTQLKMTRWEQFDIAVQSTQAFLQACIDAHVKKIIHISSTAVYGEPPPSNIITEESPYLASLFPQTSFQQAIERSVLEMDSGDTEVVVLQLGRVFGPGKGGETATMLRQMKTMLWPLVRHGVGQYNPIYIDDAVSTILCACDRSDLHRQRFIICLDQPICWRDLLMGYESILAEKATIHLPIDYYCQPQDSFSQVSELISTILKKGKVMKWANAIAQKRYGKSIYFPSPDEFRSLAAQPTFSNQKSRDRLTFHPTTSWQDGIEKIREWWHQEPLDTL